MTYDKDKALKVISNLKESNKDSDNFVLACDDLSYAISLAWIAYSTHMRIWADIPEHAGKDEKEYWACLHTIHKALCQENIFSSAVLTD